MSLPGKSAACDAESSVLRTIRDRAAAADRGEATLAPDLAALQDAGILAAVVAHTGVGGDTAAGVRLLRRIGRASLSVGRIVEGHANALRLIQLYGTAQQRSAFGMIAEQGGIFGVWGAEGREPVTFTETKGGSGVLTGAKTFCSGLGLLSVALVPVQTAAGPLLLLHPIDEPGRADASVWKVSGMRATASGRYDLTGVVADTLGQPGDYLREPHFEGASGATAPCIAAGLKRWPKACGGICEARGSPNRRSRPSGWLAWSFWRRPRGSGLRRRAPPWSGRL